jgi:hypothetical protein
MNPHHHLRRSRTYKDKSRAPGKIEKTEIIEIDEDEQRQPVSEQLHTQGFMLMQSGG